MAIFHVLIAISNRGISHILHIACISPTILNRQFGRNTFSTIACSGFFSFIKANNHIASKDPSESVSISNISILLFASIKTIAPVFPASIANIIAFYLFFYIH